MPDKISFYTDGEGESSLVFESSVHLWLDPVPAECHAPVIGDFRLVNIIRPLFQTNAVLASRFFGLDAFAF